MTGLYSLSREDVEAQVGRPLTDTEIADMTKALEFALADVVADTITQVTGVSSPEPDEDDGKEARADGIEDGDWVREDGMDWVHVRRVTMHGDQVLIFGIDGSEGSFDRDSSVYIVRKEGP